MKKGTGKKVFVGLSGGVDSSVSAALLKEAGYDVTGVFIKVWQPDFLPCSWREERRDAMRVAAKLKIPFLTFDSEKEYKKDVVDYMIREYKAGRTPNPDVMCNKYVKFGAFYKKARAMGADFVATGHYVRAKTRNLLIARDGDKDQSYFLWTIPQDVLSRTLFPVGGYKKSQVRALAKKFGLFTSEKKDSQGLCFVGKLDMKEFLSHYIKPKKGKVLNEKGEIIGSHDGAWFLTLGERHGFAINKKSPNDLALYVIGKDVKKNTVTVSSLGHISPKDLKNVGQTVRLSDVSWVSGIPPEEGKKLEARSRYRAALAPCVIKGIHPQKVILHFAKSDLTITPGQSCVLYDGEKCLGGGIID
ncbi:MAG: tRNA 2-thiouridine(34) synthase MnmA [Candidatus Paceibacterota bacterium]|jgi:tRNA-specific 2-thiouridylase